MAFEKNIIVEAKLLLIELVDSLHVLHALLEDLHLSLKSDLLLALVVGILAHDFLELLSILVLLCLTFGKEIFLGFLVQNEQ